MPDRRVLKGVANHFISRYGRQAPMRVAVIAAWFAKIGNREGMALCAGVWNAIHETRREKDAKRSC